MLKSSIPSFYQKRRAALVEQNPDGVFLFPANPEMIRNGDVHHDYRQETNFYYLSGFDEPESFLVFNSEKTVLFTLDRDPKMELWTGERYGQDRAKSIFGVDASFSNTELEKELPALLKGKKDLFYRIGIHESIDRRILAIIEKVRLSQGRSGSGLLTIFDPQTKVGELRLFKSPEEIEWMRKVCEISAQAHQAIVQASQPGMNESEIHALVEYEARKRGCARMAYGSIVGGGANATCLHYVTNNATLQDGDLLLVDAGGEYEYYAADITRTFPVGSQFTEVQSQIYDIVLDAQKSSVAFCKPGISFDDLHQHSVEKLVEGLVKARLLQGSPEENLKKEDYKKFYPHRVGHYLGMDVHDSGLYQIDGKPRLFEAGMVLTVEPGLYFQPSDQTVPQEFSGIGIRIEDDILITESGNENLTAAAPKERADIEALKRS